MAQRVKVADEEPVPKPPSPYIYDDSTEYWEPQEPRGEGGLLSEEQKQSFLSDGFVVIHGLWPSAMIDEAAAEAHDYFPEPGDEGRRTSSELDGQLMPIDRKGRLWPAYIHRSLVRWPAMPFMHLENHGRSADMALNQISLHPPVLAVAAQLMDTTPADLRLSQSVLRARYGPAADAAAKGGAGGFENDRGDQQFHVDYGNNSLVVPPRTPAPDAVAGLLYYDSIDEAGAPTHAAKARPGELTTYDDQLAPYNPPNSGEQAGRSRTLLRRLYAEERPVRYRRGTLLLYRLDAWHRGTAPLPGKHRVNHHLIWRKSAAEWISWQSYPTPLSSLPPRFLSSLSPVQRGVLGFPMPGDAYWNEHTVKAVGRRYGDMDMAPYAARL